MIVKYRTRLIDQSCFRQFWRFFFIFAKSVNNVFMIYLSILIIIVIILLIVLIMLKREKLPSFSGIDELVEFLRDCDRTGQGVSLGKFKSVLSKQYKKSIANVKSGEKLFGYEKWLVDNRYKLLEVLKTLQKFNFSRLPHSGNLPRIVTISRFAVSHGYDKTLESLIAFLKEIQTKIELDYNELSAFRCAILYAEVEKAVDCAEFSLRSNGFRKLAKKDERVRNNNYEYLYFYQLYHEVPDHFEQTIREARQEFEQTLISREINVKKVFTRISESDTLLAKELLPYFSTNDITFSKVKGYKDVSVETRRSYMKKICSLSNKYNVPENVIAESVVYLSGVLEKDISEILFNERTLKNYLKRGAIEFCEKKHFDGLYVFLVVLLSLSCFLPLLYTLDMYTAFFIPMLFLIILKPIECILKKTMSHIEKPPIFAMEYKTLPNYAETVVVVSVYVNTLERFIEAYNNLLTLSFNSVDKNIKYLLLVDLPKYSKNNEKEEQSIIDYAKKLKLSDTQIVVSIRKRININGELVAYERKRGAIMDLFGGILASDYSKFEVVNGNIGQPTFAVLLDDDSFLLPKSILNAVNTLLHPYNKKYDIMTFGAKINKHSIKTEYSLRYSEDGSIDCYPCYSDIYSDVFDKGLYCGKGIVRIKEFFEKLNGVFPDNRILSHDLIEGAFLKTGSLKVSVFEDAPQSFKSDSERKERWQKGDILLLPYLWRRVKNRVGQKIRVDIASIYKLLIFINATNGIRDLFFVLSVFLGIVSDHYYFVYISLGLLIIPFIISAIGSLLQIFRRVRLRYALRDFFKAIAHCLERIFFLPFYAYSGLITYFSTTVRTLRRNSNNLEWKPFFQSQTKSQFFAYSKLFLPSKFFMSALALISGNAYFILYAGFFVFYAFAVYKGKDLSKKYDYEENRTITDIAKKTYSYFERVFVNGLPVDNLQYFPIVKQTKMTSPTDLGFALMNELAGIKLEIVEKHCAEKKIVNILESMSKLKRYKGHFYNWYDVETKKPMYPYSISTADSANLTACLYCLYSYAIENHNEKIGSLVFELNQSDYSILFDENKGLMYISYYPDEKRGEGYYDIFESEARLAYYIAVCRGQLIDSWFNLSRKFIAKGGNTALSWFGSVFEYMMPSIFLTSPKFTMQERTERNICKYHSKNTYKGCFGISESAIHEVNEDFHYKYSPNGLYELAERFENDEYVYSPYSCILCLPYSKCEVGKSLSEYIKNGMINDCGFYDSFSEKGISFLQMTHHQGMIMCQIVNRLSNNYFAELFMKNPIMNSGKLLLAEPYSRTLPTVEKVANIVSEKKTIIPVAFDKRTYQAVFLGGNGYTIMYSSTGSNRTIMNGLDLSAFRGIGREGKNTFVKTDEEKVYQSIYSGDFDGLFCDDYIAFTSHEQSVTETIKLLPDGKGEIRRLSFEKNGEFYKIIHYFDVLLATRNEMYSHKAFYEMFVKSKIVDDCAVFSVSNKITVGIKALGFSSFSINTNKLNVLERNKSRITDFSSEYPVDGEVIYPCYAIKGEFIPSESHNSVYFVQIVGKDASDVLKILERYSYETVDEAYDLYSYKNRFENWDKTFADFVGKTVFTPYSQKELEKTVVPNKTIVKYSGLDRSDSIEKFCSACEALLVSGFNLELSLDQGKENETLIKAISRLGIPTRKDKIAIKSVWGDSANIPENLRYGFVNKPKINFDGIEVADGVFVENGFAVLPKSGRTPKPYCNILASDKVGMVLTENGVSFSWIENSRERKISPWSGDERKDIPSEDVLLWINNRLFSLTSCFNSVCVHKTDESVYYTDFENLKFEVRSFIGESKKSIVKNVTIKGKSEKRFSIVFGFRTCLNWFPDGAVYVERKENSKLRLYNKNTKMHCLFSLPDSQTFIGYDSLFEILKNNRNVEGYADYIGFVKTYDGLFDTQSAILTYGLEIKSKEKSETDKGAISINTSNKYLDVIFNDWLLKQTRDCRMNARASFYQCGGAFGFRDQLQDCLALLYSYPEKVKEHILLCASRQYEEGDVLHWWHMPRTGVRTKNSDDRLFLCYLIAKYYNRTGDKSILNRQLPFLHSAPLGQNELSRFETPSIRQESRSLYEHMKKAIFSAMNFGTHSLLLTGSGDWNDGFDRIGIKGKGESVWLTMFAYRVLTDCVDLFEGKDKIAIVDYLKKLKIGINNAFVVDRFLAYITDDGEAIGIESSKNCKIYLPTQAFAVLSGAVEPAVYNIALDTASKLVDYTSGIIKIFDEPFDDPEKYGYIGAYPKGVRENGGQYTHASIWYVKALFSANRIEEGYDLLRMLNPAQKCLTKSSSSVYAGEPYVISADVYDGDYKGRAGWTWYTGSASWYYETIIESMFGLKFVGGKMYFEPKIPKELDNSELRFCFENTTYIIKYTRSEVDELYVNGIRINENYIFPKKDGGKVFVKVNYKYKKEIIP